MTTTMKIKYVDELVRSNWTSITDILGQFSEDEIVEMVNRYQDTQRHAIAYRQKAKVTARLMKERLAHLESIHSTNGQA
jgi:hypothetical protein